MIVIKFLVTGSMFYSILAYHFKLDLNRFKRFRKAEFHEEIFKYRDLRIPPFLHSQSRSDSGVVYNF